MEALRQEAIAGDRDLSGHLGDVMLASPDIDMDVFAGQMARLRPANVTVFATANDRALSLSSAIAQSRQRVGGLNPSKPEDRERLEALGAKVYDLTNFSDGFIDHGAYADAPDVLHSIGSQMATPRPQDANTMSSIDASGYVDPSAAPSAFQRPRRRRAKLRRWPRRRSQPQRPSRRRRRLQLRRRRPSLLPPPRIELFAAGAALAVAPPSAPYSFGDLRSPAMPSKLDQLRTMTTIVSDTGDIESIRAYQPTDSTTNPSLIFKAAQLPAYAYLFDEAIAWGRKGGASTAAVVDRLTINFGIELTRIVPGRVSTEVDADLSFDVAGAIAKARAIIAAYAERGVPRERILIKLASTWEGAQAAATLQREGVDCNMTLLFSLAQAVAAADAGAFLISPFVGRIFDWHVKAGGGPYTGDTDPGVTSVRSIYAYYKTYGIKTVVMGASFRNTGEIEALAGCDRLTIAPDLLHKLAEDNGTLARRLSPLSPGPAPAKLALDEKSFRWLLNQDAMATEKLAEGIRVFAKDLNSLREMVSQKLALAA